MVHPIRSGQPGFIDDARHLIALCLPAVTAQTSLVFTYLSSRVEIRLPSAEKKSLHEASCHTAIRWVVR
jgi:hypothetical protein